MDLHWYCQVAGAFVSAMESPHTAEDLDGVDQLSVPADCCTLLRMGLYYVDAGILPIPTAIVALLEPCECAFLARRRDAGIAPALFRGAATPPGARRRCEF